MTSGVTSACMLFDQEALSLAVSQTKAPWGPQMLPGPFAPPISVHQGGSSLWALESAVVFLPRVYADDWLPFSYVPYYLPCPEIL